MGAERTLYLQFWVKVLLTFDEEVVESSHNKLPLELQNSSLIKQSMRDNDCQDLVMVLKDILVNYKTIDTQITKHALLIISQLIDWNDLKLFGEFLPYFKEFLGIKGIRA